MPTAGFEPAILGGKRPQTHALHRASTGIGFFLTLPSQICVVFTVATTFHVSRLQCYTHFSISAIRTQKARFIVPDLTIKLTVTSDIRNRYTARVPYNTDMVGDSNTSSLAYQIELQVHRYQLTVVPILQTLPATCVVPNTVHKIWKPGTPAKSSRDQHCLKRQSTDFSSKTYLDDIRYNLSKGEGKGHPITCTKPIGEVEV